MWWKVEQRKPVAEIAVRVPEAQTNQAAMDAERAAKARLEEQRRSFDAQLAQEKAKTEHDKAIDAAKKVYEKWKDAVILAESTPRMSLPAQIARMQDIRREASDLKVPKCLDEAKISLLSGMDKQIKGFFYFLGNEAKVGDKLFAIEFQSSLEDIKAFLVGLGACASGIVVQP
ncbi:hypothetical protein [Candidatus Accumulibacter contiguus]|uniref:hypothetical protein n=1 Tax=Candidatus Accumulibacter contiguus TaxID=2954381 RepID=UPI002FC3CF6A